MSGLPSAGKPSLSARFMRGVLWNGSAVAARMLILAGSFAVLGRIVAVHEMGLYSIAWGIVALASTFSQLGAARGLIYIPEVTPSHEAAAFWLSLFLAGGLALIIAAGAAPLAEAFNNPELTNTFRTGALFLPLMAMGAVDIAMQQRHLNFRLLSMMQVGGLALSAAAAITFAVLHRHLMGLFAVQGLTGLGVFILFKLRGGTKIFHRFGPSELLDVWRIGVHFSAGALTGSLVSSLPIILLGRTMATESVGLYAVSSRIIQMIALQVGAVITGTVFPTLTRVREDLGRLSRGYLLASKYSALALTLPLAMLAVAPRDALLVVVGPQWTEATQILRYLALAQIIISFSANIFPTFQAMGRPDLGWKWNIFLILSMAPTVFFLGHYGPVVVAKGLCLLYLPYAIIPVILVRGYLGVALTAYAKAMAPAAAALVASMGLGALVASQVSSLVGVRALTIDCLVVSFTFVVVALLIDPTLFTTILKHLRTRKA